MVFVSASSWASRKGRSVDIGNAEKELRNGVPWMNEPLLEW